MLYELMFTTYGRLWAAIMITFAGGLLLIQTACGLTCEERNAYAERYIDQVVSANQQCDWDDDCVNLSIVTECGNLCARAVSIDAVESIEVAVAYADDVWCSDGQAQGCGYLTPACQMPGIAWCDKGTCRND